ncbi:aldehyde dehydrogenase [Pseudomarimonas salicorniae]|uniref:Aldehyde dehydrogenase n=1 Tax=Pseudomarimonas salicorniae TaxID=2933270 RepID=A0ABT0GJK4_9GAMM|nr:aldehyde dehydrogenase [Lysobacter sp. CAU 1642]MCK7594713.1 aldehyde dehydrogenase [Lysobacter sp. CAU 1642]
MREVLNQIGGVAQSARDGRFLDVFDPATGETIARVARSGADDVEQAVTAARAAQPAWAALPHSARAAWLTRLADAMDAEAEAFIALEALDTGKPIALIRDIEFPRALANLRFFAAAITQWASESHHGEVGLNYTLRQPLGVVACISPWNLPLYLFSWKIAPALACGNAVVAKPSEITPLSATRLVELASETGLPPGVLNLVHGQGDEAGRALVAHPGVRAVSFTGSTRVGREIGRTCGEQLKKASLELGGKNACIVFADARPEGLAATLLRAGWQNSGQICLCGSRLLVQRSAYEGLREALVEEARNWTVGDPQQPATRMGPLASRAQFDKVQAALDSARQAGARILCGGQAVRPEGRCRNGWFQAPTLIEALPEDSPLHQQEIFGPVIVLQPFEDAEDALRLANGTAYGLSASVFTRDLGTAHDMAARLRAGIVWVNGWMARDLRTPFGGMGDSGIGREGGVESLRFFTEPRNVCLTL